MLRISGKCGSVIQEHCMNMYLTENKQMHLNFQKTCLLNPDRISLTWTFVLKLEILEII